MDGIATLANKLNLLLNMEYHRLDHYLSESLFLGERGRTVLWGGEGIEVVAQNAGNVSNKLYKTPKSRAVSAGLRCATLYCFFTNSVNIILIGNM